MASKNKNSNSSRTKSRTQTQRKTPSKKKHQTSSAHLERLILGLFSFLLAVFVILSMFQFDAVVLRLLSSGIKGIIGYGFWFAAPALFMISFLLLFRQREPVALRVWSCILLPFLFGALLHTILSVNAYPLSIDGLNILWIDGQYLASGGSLGGFLATLFSQLFSPVGAGFLFSLLILLLLMLAFRLTPEKIFSSLRGANQHRKERKERRQSEAAAAGESSPSHAPEQNKARKHAQVLDIPVDDPPFPPEEKPKRRFFFNRNPSVKRPDEVLAEIQGNEASQLEDTITPDEVLHSQEKPEPQEVPFPPAPDPLWVDPSEAQKLTRKEREKQIREQQESVQNDVDAALATDSFERYSPPSLSLLHPMDKGKSGALRDELSAIQKRLASTIRSFGIEATIVGSVQGPSITRYELELEQGVRLNRLTNLSDDIALALGVSSVRIAPVPGKISMVGIEVPNRSITPVRIREVLSSRSFIDSTSKVSFAVGKDIGGNYIIGDAAKLPHLLIAGTTGSGKSVCINSLLVSLLYKATPEEVRLIMVDPKMVELGIYNGIPHLLIPVVTDPKKAAGALQWAVTEMMKRYRMFSEAGVRDLASYNAYTETQEDKTKLPQIVVVIDELADLMLVAAKEVEESICRVAQMGRAAGMHLIIATQRPSADVITGLMKANIPSRIAFAVASSLESRIILDTQGAEKLVGKGDMLWFPLGSGKPLRVQGCLIDDQEVSSVVEFIKKNGSASYDEDVLQEIEQHVEEQEKGGKSSSLSSPGSEEDQYDELFPDAVEIVLDLGQASVSMLQRRLKLGYTRAARLIDQMEDRGIVGPFEGSKPRQLLITRDQWNAIQDRKYDMDATLLDEKASEHSHSPPSTASLDPVEDLPPWEK